LSYEISQLSAIASAAILAGVLVPVVDVNDTSTPPAGAGGSNKKMTIAQLLAQAGGVSLNAYGADPTGANYSDTALAAAAAVGGNITALPGTYKFANSYTPQLNWGIDTGLPNTAVVFKYTGSGTFIHSQDPAFNIASLDQLASQCYPLKGFTIDGTSAGSAAVAIEIGDQNKPDVDIGISNFTGATAIGGWLNSAIGWMNYGRVALTTYNCTDHVVFDNASGLNVMGGIDFDFSPVQLPNQNVFVFKNGATVEEGSVFRALIGSAGGASNTGTVYVIGTDGNGGGLNNCEILSYAECDDQSGTVGPVSIARGSAAQLNASGGQMVWYNSSAYFGAPTGLDPGSSGFSFSGFATSNISGDPIGNVPASTGLSVIGSSLWWPGYAGGGVVYNQAGDFFQTTLASGANTYALANLVAGRPQKILWHVQQPASGAAATLTITGAKTTAGGGAVTLSATNGYVDVIEIWTPDGVTWYAAAVGLHFH
jgi:hypothetical protein